MSAWSDGEGEGGDEWVAWKRIYGGSDEGHILKTYAVVAAVESPKDIGEGVRFWSYATWRIVGRGMDAMEGGDEGVDAGCVACQLGEVFDTVHHASASIGE